MSIERIAAEPGPDHLTVTTKACMVCKRTSRLTVLREAFLLWQRGELLQVAMPDLTDDELELLLSGTHPDCWDIAFPEEDEVDPDDLGPEYSDGYVLPGEKED
jgi:hypothetical protein